MRGKNNKIIKIAKPSIKRKTKINWPTDEELEKLVWSKPRSILAKEFGVSDKAISKRCKIKKIEQPKRGYWSKNKSSVPPIELYPSNSI